MSTRLAAQQRVSLVLGRLCAPSPDASLPIVAAGPLPLPLPKCGTSVGHVPGSADASR